MTVAKLTCRLKRRGRRLLPSPLLVTDPKRLPDPRACLGALPAGAGVLLRPYGGLDIAVARKVAASVRRHRLALMVAADWRLAAALGADGLHLPEGIARHGVLAPALGWVRRRRLLLTVACHSPAALARAKRLKAAAALLSPVFATASHPGATGIGALHFAIWGAKAGLPVIALGGVAAATVRRLRHAAGVAAIGALSGCR
jgi:thiamine-phosphate pyrophosphorylase